jgi:hypothetical protein
LTPPPLVCSGSSGRRRTATSAIAASGAGDDDIAPWVAANAMMGIHRALVDYTRRRILAGVRGARLARDVLAQAGQALALLEKGLGDLARRPS